MTKQGIFSVSQFAKLTRTTRDILLNYDRLGLLSPAVRGENNNYRYYSSDQLPLANVIRTELELGTPLAKIKRMMERRTPESTDALLASQIERIDGKMRELTKARGLALTLRKSIQSVSDIDEEAITVRHMPEEAIVLGEPNDYSRGKNDFDAVSVFYSEIDEKYGNANVGYPVWAIISAERIQQGDWRFPTRYYFCNPLGGDRRPAATYAIGYARGGYGQTDGLYRRILEYIGKNGYEICGDAYEEYPLNEHCTTNHESYLIRVMIAVREKKGRAGKKAGKQGVEKNGANNGKA